MENKNARLKNVLVSTKGDKLNFSIDISAFRSLTIDPETLTESGNSYRIAGAGSQWVKLDGELDGIMVKLDVIVSRKKYDEKKALEEQRKVAQAALAELQQHGAALKVLEQLGLPADKLAQAIMIAQTLNAQEAAKAKAE